MIGAPAPPATESSGAELRVPLIGVDGPELDACGTIGRITGLEKERLTELPVKAAPSAEAARTDILHQADLVWLCEADGEWQGIVYATGEFQDLGDCRVSIPVPTPLQYSGPCSSGWISGHYIHIVTG
ncbi:MAG: hypothetical protein ACK5NN_09375 [Sphingomonadaceae bacterium]